MLKRLLVVTVIIAMLFSFIGCNKETNNGKVETVSQEEVKEEVEK